MTSATHAATHQPSSSKRKSQAPPGGRPGQGCPEVQTRCTRPPTLCHVQVKVAGRELVQALLELGGSGWLHLGLRRLMGRDGTRVTGCVCEDPGEPVEASVWNLLCSPPSPATSRLRGTLLC